MTGGTPDEIVAIWPDGAGGWEAALASWSGEARSGDAIWHSTNGLSWSLEARSPIAWDITSPIGVSAASGRRILVAEAWLEGTPRQQVHVLTSTDGRQWEAVPSFPSERAVILAALAPASATAPWLLGGRLESAADPETGIPAIVTPTIWRSSDGFHWSAVSFPAVHTDADGTGQSDAIVAMASTRFGDIAIVSRYADFHTTYETWRSTDGAAWTPIADSSALESDVGSLGVAVGPRGVLAIGTTLDIDTTVVWELR